MISQSREVSDTPAATEVESPATARRWPWSVLEVVAVLASPVLAFYVLRLRPMAPYRISDPALETAFIFHPADMFARYSALLQPTQRLREAARVGFLVPARLDYLLFGALPGYFVTRYFFALVAVVPTYLLLRRLYGATAGMIGAVVVLSCPVIITAWGSDYSNSAMVSYLTGALACLAMPCDDGRRPLWVAIGGSLLTLAVWSHVDAVPLVGVTVVAYVLVWLARGPKHVIRDLAFLAAIAVVTTALLGVASQLELGRFDFIRPTWDAYRFLSQPDWVGRDHSRNWRWVLYDSYLLVPPAVVVSWLVTFGRRPSSVPTAQLFIGLACASQLLAACVLQFAGSDQILELFYLSSALWGAVSVTLAVVLAHLARPLLGRPLWRWMPAVLLVAVPLLYEIYPHVPSFGWEPIGLAVAAGLAALCVAGRWLTGRPSPIAVLVASGLTLVMVAGSALVLTVAPAPGHTLLAGERRHPPPDYAAALGGSAGEAVDAYQISSELPRFVGGATYRGEVLVTWWNPTRFPTLLPSVGLYHAELTAIGMAPPRLTAPGRKKLNSLRPAEVLVLTLRAVSTPALLRALHRYKPVVLRGTVLRSGSLEVHALLISLRRFGPKTHHLLSAP